MLKSEERYLRMHLDSKPGDVLVLVLDLVLGLLLGFALNSDLSIFSLFVLAFPFNPLPPPIRAPYSGPKLLLKHLMMTGTDISDMSLDYDALQAFEGNGRYRDGNHDYMNSSLVDRVDKVSKHPMIKAVCSDSKTLYQLEASVAPEVQHKFFVGSHFEPKLRDIVNGGYVLSNEDLVHTRSPTLSALEHKLKVRTLTPTLTLTLTLNENKMLCKLEITVEHLTL